jgi:hypothetical protein
MPATDKRMTIYREVAERYDRCGQDTMRDRFLVLAADAALSSNHVDEAERLHSRLLERNPQHLLRPYSSFEEAMRSVDVQNYVAALRRAHPFEKAEYLLETLQAPSSGTVGLPDDAKILPLTGSEEEARGRARAEGNRRGSPDAASRYSLQPSSPESKRINPVFNGPSRQSFAPSKRTEVPADIYPILPDPDPKTRQMWAATSTQSSGLLNRIVSFVLAALLLLGGLALALYTLARPFLPESWLH